MDADGRGAARMAPRCRSAFDGDCAVDGYLLRPWRVFVFGLPPWADHPHAGWQQVQAVEEPLELCVAAPGDVDPARDGLVSQRAVFQSLVIGTMNVRESGRASRNSRSTTQGGWA
jgi:hypothetical protein